MAHEGWWQRVTSLVTRCMRPRPCTTGEALLEAAERGDWHVVRLLLVEASRSNALSVSHRETALVLAAHEGCDVVVQELLSDPRVGADKDRVGVALVRAAVNGHFGIISFMAAARPEAFSTEAAALALRRAAQNDCYLCVRMLLRGGVPADAHPPGSPAPLFAAAVGSPACVVELVKGGANVNQVDESGRTPLHHAAAANELGCIEELVWAGANRRAADNEGHLARDEAISQRARDLLSPDSSPVRRVVVRDAAGPSHAPDRPTHLGY